MFSPTHIKAIKDYITATNPELGNSVLESYQMMLDYMVDIAGEAIKDKSLDVSTRNSALLALEGVLHILATKSGVVMTFGHMLLVKVFNRIGPQLAGKSYYEHAKLAGLISAFEPDMTKLESKVEEYKNQQN